MNSVLKRFAGFRSVAAILKDRGLTKDQKRTALMSWRFLLMQSPAASVDADDRLEKLQEIEHALVVLDKT